MKKIRYPISLMVLVGSFLAFHTHAQDKSEKGTIKIDLAYHQLNNDLPVIMVSTKTKKDRRFEPVAGAEVNVFIDTETSNGFIGRVKTDSHGAGSVSLPARFKTHWDSLSGAKFIGTVTQNDLFENQSTELEISKARIELTLEEKDTVRTIHAKVVALKDKNWVVEPEIEIKLVVRGLMSDFKITEEETLTTDENGEISADFALTIPGDADGNIMIGAKIDDNDLYGSLVSTKTAKWGVPLTPDKSFAKRTLWATRDKTPLWLLIFPNLIIVSVWGIIFYLFYQLRRIIKIGRTNELHK